MTFNKLYAGAVASAIATLCLYFPGTVSAEPLIWGVQMEQLEYRLGEDENFLAWDFDVLTGTDELKAVWRSEAEYEFKQGQFETLENQLRLQAPISAFFDAVIGVRVDTPEVENRVYGVIGMKGLAKQWFEIDADLYLGETSFFRFEVEYEGLITNRLILTPSVEIEVPFQDDEVLGVASFAPTIELGARLSYDVVDRLISPYVGVHYERKLGESGDLARAEGETEDALFFVVGLKVLF
jgi:copper resistance protein B